MPKISIIVPVYKVESYIHRCVESILAQKFADYEVILVDDGSPDNCGMICDEYARKDSRFRVIHKENGGLSSARNAGIRIATGEYTCFVDSDDLIHPQFLSLLVQSIPSDGYCFVACDVLATPTIPNDFFSLVDSQPTASTIIDEPFVSELVTKGYSAWTAWAKIIPTDIVRRHPFTEGRIYEDNAVVLSWLLECERFACVEYPLYLYFADNPSGIVRTSMTQKKNMDFMWALSERYHTLMKAGMRYLATQQLRQLLFWGKGQGEVLIAEDLEAAAEIREFLRPYWRYYVVHGSFRWKNDRSFLAYMYPSLHKVKRLFGKVFGK